MSRNFYNGTKKKRVALLNADGDLEALQKGGQAIDLRGTTTMTSGRAVVSGTAIKSTSFVVATPAHGGPTALSWAAFDGYVIVSGTGNGVVGYQIII
jgi:hypothetical protein